jgi:Transposase DDE domain
VRSKITGVKTVRASEGIAARAKDGGDVVVADHSGLKRAAATAGAREAVVAEDDGQVVVARASEEIFVGAGIDEQVAKAQRAVDGHAPVKRNRHIQVTGATKSVNRTLEDKTRALAGWKGYTTNLVDQPASFVIDAYHQLWRIEKAFRMSKHDLQARPIYHRTRDSIEAHLTVVFAAMAVSHWIETQTGWSIKKFVRTARRYRAVHIKAGNQTLTVADPLPDDLAETLAKITSHDVH